MWHEWQNVSQRIDFMVKGGIDVPDAAFDFCAVS